MKKLYLLPVLLFLVLISCQDEAPAPQTSDEQLYGTWGTVSQRHKYYDVSGQLVHEKVDSIETVFDFDGAQVTTTYSTGTSTQCTYAVFEDNGRDYIQLTLNGSRQSYEITSITGTQMYWVAEAENVQSSNSGMETADRTVITIEFSRR